MKPVYKFLSVSLMVMMVTFSVLAKKIEAKLEKKIESKVESKIESKVELKAEQKVDKKIEQEVKQEVKQQVQEVKINKLLSPYKAGELIVKLKPLKLPDGDFLKKNELISAKDLFVGHKSRRPSKYVNNFDNLYITKVTDSSRIEAILDKLKSNPRVQYVELNYIVNTQAIIPNDSSFFKLWGMNNIVQTGGTSDADIDATEAWDLATSSNLLVGIVDTGVDYTHEDLSANIWTNPGEIPGNGIDDDNNGYIDDIHGWDFVNNDNDPMDDQGHGTHVAGTIAAVGNNGIGVTGVNWRGKIVPLKFLNASGSGTITDAVKAIQYANMMGIKITNNSWGGGGFSQTLYDAISAGNTLGTLFVAASGNSGVDTDISPIYPAAYDLPNIISIAATDHNDSKASFSNYGANTVDLGAPGVNIFSSVPKVNCSLCDSSGYRFLNGTSMATPHVSGAVALFWNKNSFLSNFDIKNKIMNLSDPVSFLAGITVSGKRLNLYNLFKTPMVSTTTLDIISPLTSITYPLNNTSLLKGSTVNIVAVASDNVGVTKVEFYINGTRSCTNLIVPYSCSLKLSFRVNKKYKIQSKAYDAAGNSKLSTIVTVTTK